MENDSERNMLKCSSSYTHQFQFQCSLFIHEWYVLSKIWTIPAYFSISPQECTMRVSSCTGKSRNEGLWLTARAAILITCLTCRFSSPHRCLHKQECLCLWPPIEVFCNPSKCLNGGGLCKQPWCVFVLNTPMDPLKSIAIKMSLVACWSRTQLYPW